MIKQCVIAKFENFQYVLQDDYGILNWQDLVNFYANKFLFLLLFKKKKHQMRFYAL